MPRRSLWGRRRLVSVWAVTLTTGLVTLVLSGTPLGGLLVPGPLAKHHGRIADCGNCHVAYRGGLPGWVLAALEGPAARRDSLQCLGCHEHAPDDALAPHTVPAAMLAAGVVAPGRPPIEQMLVDALFTPPHEAARDGLACATCHSEHRGRDAARAELSNGRCQACHETTFAAFADGHPPFTGYPYLRRTRIVFDHQSHAFRHFPEHDPPREDIRCVDCHTLDTAGRGMTARSYEGMCAECHDGDIRGVADAGPRGVAFMQVPGFDLVELRERGIGIGEWPEHADGPLTPFMRVLIETRPELTGVLARVEDVDLLDLREADAEDVAAVERLAWGIKGLVHELAVEGAPGMAARMAGSVDVPIDERQLRGLAGLLPPDVAHAALQAWFPGLHRELALRARGVPVPTAGGAADETAAEALSTPVDDTGGLLAGDDDTGGLLTGDTGTGDLLTGDDDTDSLLAGDDDDTGSLLTGDTGTGDLLTGDDDTGSLLAGDDDTGGLLTGDTGTGDLLAGDNDDTGSLLAGDDRGHASLFGSAGDDGRGIPAGDTGGGVADPLQTGAMAPLDEPPDVDHERLARLGGWYRDDLTLYYRPAGHADPFLRSHLDIVGRAPAGSEARRLFDRLAADDAPGRCSKCHGVDRRADRGLEVQWSSWRPNLDKSIFTVFSHKAHFMLSAAMDSGCVTCHVFGSEGKDAYLDAFSGNDPTVFTSSFDALPISVCADCHTPEVAGDDCTTCHRYHGERFVTRAPPTGMDDVTARHAVEQAPAILATIE